MPDIDLAVILADGEYLRRSGDELIGDIPAGTGGGGGGPVTIADLPAGTPIDVEQASDGTWPARPTARTDIRVNWIGYPGSTVLPSGALSNRDSHVYRVAP